MGKTSISTLLFALRSWFRETKMSRGVSVISSAQKQPFRTRISTKSWFKHLLACNNLGSCTMYSLKNTVNLNYHIFGILYNIPLSYCRFLLCSCSENVCKHPMRLFLVQNKRIYLLEKDPYLLIPGEPNMELQGVDILVDPTMQQGLYSRMQLKKRKNYFHH